MKERILYNKVYIFGAIAGAFAGFLYWKLIGCNSGTCAITSNPYRSTLYFAFMGSLVGGLFKQSG